jgi:hypothetical protein
MIPRLTLARLILLGSAPLLGCGSPTLVKGTVTMDGQPVASGAVTFVKTDGELMRAGAVISNGSFQMPIIPGEYRVELNGQKVVGKRKQKGFDGKDEVVELTEELFPEQYNVKSVLKQQVKPGANTVMLEAKSGPAQ